MRRDVPAEFAISKFAPGATQTLYTCGAHAAASIRALDPSGTALAVIRADPAKHGCKGCDADWPTD